MDFIRVELEEKYIADIESREECIAFSVYIKSGDFSGRGTFVYTVNQFRQLISQLKLIYITLDGEVDVYKRQMLDLAVHMYLALTGGKA